MLVVNAAWSVNQRRIFCCDEDAQIRIWDWDAESSEIVRRNAICVGAGPGDFCTFLKKRSQKRIGCAGAVFLEIASPGLCAQRLQFPV
jgi:hypothetical protein